MESHRASGSGIICHKLNDELPNFKPLIQQIRSTVLSQLDSLPSGQLLPVYSAFNGFVIYRVNKMAGCRYNGSKQCYHPPEKYAAYSRETGLRIDPDRIENCEHIAGIQARRK